MHRLFNDALDDVDLAGDVVPGVLAGYEHKVRVRRYQAAGVALAVLATAGVAVGTLPRDGNGAVAPASTSQGTDYCTHQHWVLTPHPGTVVENELAANPAADQANCEALRTALGSAFPDAQLMPAYTADLTLDPRADQALVKKDHDETTYHDPLKGSADQMKDFGPELKYLAVHPEDPANVYYPDSYMLVAAAGREHVSVNSLVSGSYDPAFPLTFVGSADSADCGKMPEALKKTVECTTVGKTGGWHGALWREPDNSGTTWQLTAVLTDKQGKTIRFSTGGDDVSAWYREGTYDGTLDNTAGKSTKWINRWTGQAAVGQLPPVSHVVTEAQVTRFLDSSAFQKYADSYLAYIGDLPKS
jgi:hypothetical protein